MALWPKDFELPDSDMSLPSNDVGHPLAQRFKGFIEEASFPCVGAKSAVKKGDLTMILAGDIRSKGSDQRIHTALLGFIARYRLRPELFQSFAVIFEDGKAMTEMAFEKALWQRVQSVSDKDNALGHAWDKRVDNDPDNPHFSLSFGGEAFFVVGLHPGASRPARRFSHPVLVFNLHDQFERLRAEGRYEKLRSAILERDQALAGSINPMLARHGEKSEARQYSGRAVGSEWSCPFNSRRPQGRHDDRSNKPSDTS